MNNPVFFFVTLHAVGLPCASLPIRNNSRIEPIDKFIDNLVDIKINKHGQFRGVSVVDGIDLECFAIRPTDGEGDCWQTALLS